MSRIDKTKTIVETTQIVIDVVTGLLDRRQKQKDQEKRIKELEAENERLKKELEDARRPVGV